MSKVYVKFPKTGLGNLLLVWANAQRFAEINGLEMITSPWWGFRWGAWLRNEKKKRLYMGYFRESSFTSLLKIKLLSFFVTVEKNPAVNVLSADQQKTNRLFVFDTISTGDDIFVAIREYRDNVRAAIYQMLQPAMLKKLNTYATPEIGVHIRRGDFKIGNQITSLSFFTDCIKSIRAVAGNDMPVTIFTDAKQDEIEALLQLPNISIAENKPDILDILLMSKSKIMVLSKSSTFSYWAAFLSNAIVLRPHDDWQRQIRSESINRQYNEIGWKINDPDSFEKLRLAISNTAAVNT